MGMLLTYREGYWPKDGKPAERAPAEPDAYDELTDEQVAEAYATNVAGNATTRKGQVKALRKLDADAAATEVDEGAPEGGSQATEDEQPKDDSGE